MSLGTDGKQIMGQGEKMGTHLGSQGGSMVWTPYLAHDGSEAGPEPGEGLRA